ncbi:ABC transporter substrate-binding protein [Agrobacterium leguminum]|uniref:ABC transporter substrate-binding protein n=1 Tax=Agrobacterium leguminum TaxID=2792015 RepID=UPI00272C9B7D|nr:ABC transporter substrate-binding protein [Agrobacterium leguminum]WLD96307.1 ABC transporter substrate-binding protein [Agrobacterium leguminum]
MLNRRTFLSGFFAALLPSVPLRAEERKRIAAIDWAAAESLLALGVTPRAVADTGYYNQRMPQALPAETLDIGPFWEINLELLDRIRPDLILIGAPSLFMTPRLREIAPVEVVEEMVGEESYGRAAAILKQCGRAAGLPGSTAEAFLAGIEREMDALAARIDRMRPVCILLPDQSGSRAMVYGNGSMPGSVINRLGLVNAWQGQTNASGFIQVGFEALMALEDAIFMQMEIPTLTHQTERVLANSQLWQRLPAVRRGRVNRLGQFYPFGGCLSTLHLAAALTAAVLDQSGAGLP